MSSPDDPLAHGLPLFLSNRGLYRDYADGTGTRVADLDRFRRCLRHWSVKYLCAHFDLFPVAWDEAAAQGDNNAFARAEAERNAVWDEIKQRDAIASKAAS